MARKPGTLYVCSTPIGNLDDITLRALETLRSVALIAAEDTRQTAKLLRRYEISAPTTSLHQHNEASKTKALLDRLLAGDDVALVSDAGTPILSDPGLLLVQAAIDHGVTVTPVPGASALLAALVASGFPATPFYFGGFLPRKKGERTALLKAVGSLDATLVFYESPHRLVASLKDVAAIFPRRRVAVARELTKLHETVERGLADELVKLFSEAPPKGECALLVEGAQEQERGSLDVTDAAIQDALITAIAEGMTKKEAIRTVAAAIGAERNRVYRLAHALPRSAATPDH